MGKMVKVAAKKPEAKIENKASKTKQTCPSQSISSPVEQILLLQRTIGNQSVQRLIRSGALQAKLKIGQPGDIYEREADRMAEHVMKMPQVFEEKKVSNPARNNPIQRLCSACIKGTKPKIEEEGKFIQTKEASGSTPEVTPQLESSINAARGGGQPLPESVRAFYEPRFGADFSQVRVDTGSYAAETAKSINAKAFTVGNNIAFGGGQFAPGTHEGGKLLAHELTHTIQQGAGVQRSPQISTMVTPSLVQRDFLDFLPDIPNPLEYLANKAIGFITRNAAAVPGFTMLTVIMGKNPLTGAAVDRSPGNILKGAIEMMPGGSFITEALNNHGIFDKVSAWTSQQFNTLKEIGSNILQDVKNFVHKFSILDLKDPGAVWEKAKNIVTAPIGQIKSFAIGLKNDIVTFVKDAILKPIAAYAKNNTNGYPLLCAVMGKDPISGEPVPQDANALLGGFMKFIGEEETWTNMQKAGAVPRAFAWFKGAVNAVKGFVSEIPGAFVAAFKALDITDLILIPKAFIKLAKVFGSFAGRFISWGFNAVWNLLEIIFDSLKPGIMGYIKRTGAALKSILKNPMPFVGNLVKAAIQGFKNFAANFGSHLKAGLIDWLTGSLTGVYIPKALSLLELGKFALSVLGITWTKIRGKIVKALGPTGEKIMKALETGFDMIVSLVKGGPAAAWELIKEKLSDLKDTVVSGIIGFVTETVVMKAVPKLIAMFIPGAGFISAIISIYDTVMVFVQKISKIAQVVVAFIDSIVTIAAGNIGAAASRVESILGSLVSLAISFLAGFAGLGKVADKIVGVIGKVIGAIDKAWDWVINIIVGKAKAWFAKLFGGKDKDDKEKKLSKDKLNQAAVKEITMMGTSHYLTIDMKEGGVDAQMASSRGNLIQKVNDEIATQEDIIRKLSPIDTDMISYHTRAKTRLQSIVTTYEKERLRINGLRTSAGPDEVQAMMSNLGEQLAVKIIQVAAEFRLDDFVRKTFNIAEHLEVIRRQVEDQIEKHANNPKATGDRMAYTAAVAELYLGWVEPGGRRHVDKVSVAMKVIDGALKELDKLTQHGVDMRGERWYVRGKSVLEMCTRAMSMPDSFLWNRGITVVEAYIDDMDARGLRGNGNAVAAAKRRLGRR